MVHEAGGLVAAAFRHRTSRMGDPQLHTHVLVANLGRGPDGRWSALDARRIYAHARAASFIYQAVLRGELTRELGVEWTAVRDGIAEIDGVPPEVLRAFSRRRAQIEAALIERGTGGARAAEAAALSTRRRKSGSLDGEALRWQWTDRAADLGFDRRTSRGSWAAPAGMRSTASAWPSCRPSWPAGEGSRISDRASVAAT